jgi:hypothetical protein
MRIVDHVAEKSTFCPSGRVDMPSSGHLARQGDSREGDLILECGAEGVFGEWFSWIAPAWENHISEHSGCAYCDRRLDLRRAHLQNGGCRASSTARQVIMSDNAAVGT